MSDIARLTHDPKSPTGGEYFSMRFRENGAFRICLSKLERQKVTKNSDGQIELHFYNEAGDSLVHVHHVEIIQLSKDPKSPSDIVIQGIKGFE